jgi:hypothetical protein
MKNFNPLEWLDKPAKQAPPKELIVQQPVHTAVTNNDIESYISSIEQSGTDITGDYATWRNIGFALASQYGEQGRDMYHRVSRNYADYDHKECDDQFTKCLTASGHGINIATFYHHAHNAGIKLVKSESAIPTKQGDEPAIAMMPVIPQEVHDTVPEFLKAVTQPASSPEERDILLIGALTVLSACFPNLYGFYDERKVYANLYLFVTAAASAGKGKLNQLKKLVMPIHKMFREQSKSLKQQHDAEMATYNMNKNKSDNLEKPVKPPERMLFIPANNSTTGVYQLISDNEGRGLMFETEGDTLTQAFKSDYGNYSDGFRKAFHHENISYYRRTDRELVDIEKPCLSTLLSGTPKQIALLVPNAENGLFSRFVFYYMNIKPEWKDVFATHSKVGLEEHYTNLGNQFLGLYKTLKNNPEIRVTLSRKQQQRFNEYFSKMQAKYISIQPMEYIATVRRLGLVAFRMAMIFTALRTMEDGDVNTVKECEDVDFENCLKIITVLVEHSSAVFNNLPAVPATKRRPNKKERFLKGLPKEFDRTKYLEIADANGIPHKTAEGYMTKFVKDGIIHRESHGQYLIPDD